VPVGAIGVLLISLSARHAFRVGAGAALGVATADGLYALVAVLGGAAVASLIEPVATPLRIVAAMVLLGIAAQIAVSAARHARVPGRELPPSRLRTTPRAYAGVLALTILNPVTIIYFTALVLGQREPFTPGERVVFVIAVFVASASWQLLLASGGSMLGKWLAGPRGSLATALVSSAVIVALAVRTLI
jgi:threonine/homoserine/homoserine lactone efflux protein